MANNLIPFSRGIAVNNLDLNSKVLSIYLEQIHPMVDGQLSDKLVEYKTEFKDGSGKMESVMVNTSVAIQARWLCREPNRMTPPTVRAGALVQVYREGNSDSYYWETTTNTNNYQKLERVVYAYSDTKKENTEMSDTNAWTQGVDTFNKKVNLITTTKSDGESFAYQINVDAKDNTITIKDDVGNQIVLNSKRNMIELKNSMNSLIRIEGDKITMDCKTMEVNANTVNIKASNQTTIDTPTTTHTGKVNTRARTTTGGITSNGLNLDTHRHKETNKITLTPM